MNFYWDTDENQLLAVETRSIADIEENSKHDEKVAKQKEVERKNTTHNQSVETEILVMFYNESGAIKVLETLNLSTGEQLVNLCVPYIVSISFICCLIYLNFSC